MKTKLFLIIISLNIISVLSAQTLSIKGKVVENASIPLSFTSILLMDSDSTVIANATSDANGLFILNNVKAGSYILSISFLGYTTSTIELKNIENTIDLGFIELNEAPIELNEVTIKASNVIQKIDRQVILPTADEIKRSVFNNYKKKYRGGSAAGNDINRF